MTNKNDIYPVSEDSKIIQESINLLNMEKPIDISEEEWLNHIKENLNKINSIIIKKY